MDELMEQTDLARTLIINKETDSPTLSTSKNISYAEAIKLFPNVLTPILSRTLSKDQINEKNPQVGKNGKCTKQIISK